MGPHWETGPLVLEHRYSIHPSPRSAEFTTIKQTINLEGGKSITTVALTDAVKKKTGFSIIWVRRCQNLVDAPIVVFKPQPQDRFLTLNQFDPTKFTLFIGLFIGHPDAKFEAADDEIIISPFNFRNFQIVVMASLFSIPSWHTTEFLHALTTRPELARHEQQEKLLRYLMIGKPSLICLQQYRNSVSWLAKHFLEQMLPQVQNSDVAMAIKQRIKELGRVSLTEQELGMVGRSIHMLENVKLPNSQ